MIEITETKNAKKQHRKIGIGHFRMHKNEYKAEIGGRGKKMLVLNEILHFSEFFQARSCFLFEGAKV